ncbi:hypothetical protein DU508_03255 [Pedobacter chinensis]|uniref:Uncharacterized protein n=1 Tax=Pedobacter chinensis TaxID=2282421 RepID=A0A369PZC3_9SPHI|nr:hypothetical protein [Pedobacter chinensis]RDC57983.1 hypothetical protein DU508_03255 [Pedobacter chinensis]
MATTDKSDSKLENGNERKDQEQLNQQALGNTDITQHPEKNNNDILNVPKSSGTGSNLPSAAPDSLIVHEDEEGDARYEKGSEAEENSDHE